MDDIEKQQYKNLRACFKKNLVEPILGKDYYNLAMDVYKCDEITTEDLKEKFDKMKSTMLLYRYLFKISLIVIFCIALFGRMR